MSQPLSRRELLAWLTAGAGATATGFSVLERREHSGAPLPKRSSNAPSSTATALSADDSPAGSTSSASSIASLPDRLLLVIEMPGGNDGLSTVVPYGDGAYYDLRRTTAIAEADVLDLDGQVGLHPSLVGMHERGVTVVDGVGSTVPNGSHFEMQQRWWAGNSTTVDGQTGWIGRVADLLADADADASPAAGLSVGSGAHPIIASATGSTVSMPSADSLWAVSGADPGDAMRVAYQRTLRSFAASDEPLAGTLRNGLDFADRMVALGLDDEDADDLGYENWGLGRSLQFAATVLAGDVGVRIVHVQTDGDFDTHEGHAWKHPELMRALDTNLTAFHADLHQRGLDDRVMVMTTSEFGRTASENESGGLDHGTASTMLLSGPGTGAMVGESPSLTKRDDNDDLVATVPFEAYLGGVVEGWLGVPADEVFGGGIAPLQLF